MEMVG